MLCASTLVEDGISAGTGTLTVTVTVTGGSYHHSSISLMDKVLSESVVPWKSLYIKWDQGINRRVNTFEDQRII